MNHLILEGRQLFVNILQELAGSEGPGAGSLAGREVSVLRDSSKPGLRPFHVWRALPRTLATDDGAGPGLLGDVFRPQVRVVGLEGAHHVHAARIVQDHHLNPA